MAGEHGVGNDATGRDDTAERDDATGHDDATSQQLPENRSQQLSEARGASASADATEFDRLFDLLSKERRRHVLYCLNEAQEQEFSVAALVERLAALEEGTSPGSRGRAARREIEISLQHTHLPKLAEASVVAYDPDESVVEFQGGALIEEWTELAADAELRRDSS